MKSSSDVYKTRKCGTIDMINANTCKMLMNMSIKEESHSETSYLHPNNRKLIV